MRPDNFFLDRHERALRCVQKDAVICPILNSIEPKNTSTFKALLMACLHAPELYILRNKGVHRRNLVGIEKDPEIWRRMKGLRGLDMGPRPMEVNEALDSIVANHPSGFDLIYLDLWSQINFHEMWALKKIMHFRMIRPGGKLILNFGKSRTQSSVKEVNDMLLKKGHGEILPTKLLVKAAMERSSHVQPKYIQDHPYKSKVAGKERKYLTTEAQW